MVAHHNTESFIRENGSLETVHSIRPTSISLLTVSVVVISSCRLPLYLWKEKKYCVTPEFPFTIVLFLIFGNTTPKQVPRRSFGVLAFLKMSFLRLVWWKVWLSIELLDENDCSFPSMLLLRSQCHWFSFF